MAFPVKVESEVAVIVPSGRVTVGEPAESLRRAIEDAFGSGARSILIDVRRTPYMDSSGIGEMLAALRTTRERGGRVGIFGPRGKIHEILEVTKLAELFVWAGTEEEARSKIAAEA